MFKKIQAFCFLTIASSLMLWFWLKKTPTHYLVDCSIYNEKFELMWSLGSNLCWFKEDGSLVTYRTDKLIFFSQYMKVMASHPISAHHQINFINDKYYIFSDAFNDGKTIFREAAASNQTERYDFLTILKTNGEIEKQINLTEFYERNFGSAEPTINFTEKYLERTHFNSIYEVPYNSLSKEFIPLSQGNLIFNDNRNHVTFITDPDVTKILWTYRHKEPGVHDVQVTKSGRILYFHNQEHRKQTQIETLHPITEEITLLYPNPGKEIFFQPRLGKVKMLDDDHLLLTFQHRFTKKILEVSISDQRILHEFDVSMLYPEPENHIKILEKGNFSSFLSHNSGL